jgi:hypothetical protein
MENLQLPKKSLDTQYIGKLLLVLVLFVGVSNIAFVFLSSITERKNVSTINADYVQNEGLEFVDNSVPNGILFASGKNTFASTTRDTILSFDLSDPKNAIADLTNPAVYAPRGINFLDKIVGKRFLLTASTPESVAAGKSIGLGTLHLFETSKEGKSEVIKVYSAASGNSVAGAVMSPDGSTVAYSHLKNDLTNYNSADSRDIENWETVLLDTDSGSVLRVIDKAVWPIWVYDSITANTSLLLLRYDGIYIHDTITTDEKPLIVANSLVSEKVNLNTQTKFALSSDKKHIVVVSPYMSRIEVFAVDSISSAQAHSVGRLTSNATAYYTPVISPDGAHYAVSAINNDGTNPRIEIRSIFSRVVSKSIGLPQSISLEGFSINDWLNPLP